VGSYSSATHLPLKHRHDLLPITRMLAGKWLAHFRDALNIAVADVDARCVIYEKVRVLAFALVNEREPHTALRARSHGTCLRYEPAVEPIDMARRGNAVALNNGNADATDHEQLRREHGLSQPQERERPVEKYAAQDPQFGPAVQQMLDHRRIGLAMRLYYPTATPDQIYQAARRGELPRNVVEDINRGIDAEISHELNTAMNEGRSPASACSLVAGWSHGLSNQGTACLAARAAASG
jgi:hypothetical protein